MKSAVSQLSASSHAICQRPSVTLVSYRTRASFHRPNTLHPSIVATRSFSSTQKQSTDKNDNNIVITPYNGSSSENKSTPVSKLGLKQLISQYGAFIILTYTGVWISTGIGCYAVVSSIGADAVLEGLKHIGAGNYVDLDKFDPRLGNAAVAFVINECLEPIRLPIYLACIRPAVNRYDAWLRSRGRDPSMVKDDGLLSKLRAFGPLGIAYYTSVWAGTGLLSYLTINTFGPEFAINSINYLGISDYVDLSRLDPKLGNAAVAFVVNELIEPVRLPFVLATLGPVKRRVDKMMGYAVNVEDEPPKKGENGN